MSYSPDYLSGSSSVYLITSDGRTLYLPIPSISPKDPLNWSPAKRATALGSLLLFSILVLWTLQGTSLILPQLEKEYTAQDAYPFSVQLLASVSSLFLGLGVFLWIPLSLAIGRRPVFLLCNILFIASALGCAISKTYAQHLVARIFMGLSAGSTPATILLGVIDMTYIYQRATVLAIFWSMGAMINNLLLPVVPHIVKCDGGWRNLYWLGLILGVFSFIVILFFCPETYFCRPPVAFDGRILVQSSTEKVTICESWTEVPDEKELPAVPTTCVRLKLHELKFWGAPTKDGWKAMGRSYPHIFMAFLNPLIFWVMLLNALVFARIVTHGVTYGELLSSEPYNQSTEKIAYINFAGAAGSLLAYPVCGPMSAAISRRLTARNGGRQTAEHFLVSFILPVLVGLAAAMLYGFAGKYHLHVAWIYLSHGMIFFAFISLFTSTTLWATEAFPRWAAASLAIVGGGAYVTSFALSFAIKPWIAREGFAKMNIEHGALILGVGLIGVPIAIWGKKWRIYIERRWLVGDALALRPQ